jgi:hypothetical protein
MHLAKRLSELIVILAYAGFTVAVLASLLARSSCPLGIMGKVALIRCLALRSASARRHLAPALWAHGGETTIFYLIFH